MKVLLFLVCVALGSAKECGVKRSGRIPNRIVGGVNAEKGEFPWQVSWRFSKDPGVTADRHICGGTIVNENWVITAAHCVDLEIDGVPYKEPKYFKALLGEHNLEIEEPEEVKINVKRIIIHPQWNSQNLNNDLALIELERPIDFDGKESHVSPVCLGDSRLPNLDDKIGLISGWGKTSNDGNTLPPILQKATVNIVAQATCRSRYSFINSIVDGMICAGGDNVGVCNGDSGGPLHYKHSDGKFYQVGITSWGIANMCGAKSFPGVFTRVTEYYDFIKQTTGVTL